MIQVIFKFLLNMLASIVQAVCYIPNQVIIKHMPDISDKITQVTNGFNTLFSGISWGLGMLPNSILVVLVFIVSIEIVKHTIFIGTRSLQKVWTLLQKIKFW